MSELRFRRLQELFDSALERDPAEHEDYARSACADDPELAEELLRLLRRHVAKRVLPDRAVLPALESTLRLALPEAFVEGSLVGAYRIVEGIGDGGMGRVYRARREDGEVEQEVAIKLIRSELLNPALLSRFSTERRVLAALNHPNICRFLDAGTLPDSSPYVVMELVSGAPLLDYCQQRRLGLPARLRLLRRVAAAVAHAHGQLVVHRDIKSSNVLVDDRCEPKLLDFGIASSLDGPEPRQRTATAERFFTPVNAAPEQIGGGPVGVGCDIYALGLLAYELLCGQPPFDLAGLRAGEIERLLLRVPAPLMSQRAAAGDPVLAQSRGYASPAALARALRGDLDQIIARCLRKEPGERYASVEQFDADLDAVLAGQPIAQRRFEQGYRLRKFIARNRLAVALVGSLLLTFVTASGVVSWQAWSLVHERNQVVIERDRAQYLVDLLKQSFVAADPAKLAGEALRMGDVLAALRPRLDALRMPQPDLYASLADTLSEVELSLGMDRSAADLAEQALLAAGPMADAPMRRRLVLNRAIALTRIGDHAQALVELDRVREFDAVEQADWLVAQGRLLGRRARFDEAEDALRRAVAMLADRGPDDELATTARLELAQALRNAHGATAALAEVEAMLGWQLRELSETHPQVLRARLFRVELLIAGEDRQLPVREARQLLAEVLASLGAESTLAARAAGTLAWALHVSGQAREALEMARVASDTWDRSLGTDHAQSVRSSYNLGLSLAESPGSEDEALAVLQNTLERAERRFGASADATHFMRNGLARLQLRERRWSAALETLAADTAQEGLDTVLEGNRSARLELVRTAVSGDACNRPERAASAHACQVLRQVLQRHHRPAGNDQ